VVVAGPTASGKSALGIALAQEFNGEIVSADSRQVYRGLDIGAAKVTPEERALVPHHLLDVADPNEIYTVARFQQEATRTIDAILARGRQPFLVGGSPELRAQLETRPLAELLAELEQLDPLSAASIDRQNPRRVIRALEVCLVTGQPFSAQRKIAAPLYNCLQLAIDWPRPQLYARIDRRVDERMEQGMLEEVRRLLAAGVTHERLEAFGLEYRFLSRFLRGEFPNEAEMVQRLKFAIHDFTRRQLTWLRKDRRIVWIDGQRLDKATDLVRQFLESATGQASPPAPTN
jgi:tRNA dimethylallyltransferase